MKTFFTQWRSWCTVALLVMIVSLSNAQQKFLGVSPRGGNQTWGTIFTISSDGSGFQQQYVRAQKLLEKPQRPAPVNFNGKLYGALNTGNIDGSDSFGGLYEFDPVSKEYKVLYTIPSADLGRNIYTLSLYNGKIYGTTNNGGTNNGGVIFSYDLSASGDNAYTKLCDFDGTGLSPSTLNNNSILAGIGDKIFGVTDGGGIGSGGIFSFDLTKSGAEGFTKLFEFDGGSTGNTVAGGLTVFNGKLYGTTAGGGDFGGGVVYSFDPAKTDATGFTKVYEFDQSRDGAILPGSSLTALGSKLYGMTFQGGDFGAGILYSIDLSNNTMNKLYSFDGSSEIGGSPQLDNLDVYNNLIVGTTWQGGPSNTGVLFTFDPSKTGPDGIKKISDLKYGDPVGAAISVYGDRAYIHGGGTLYSIGVVDKTTTVDVNFSDAIDGGFPTSITKVDDEIYGTTDNSKIFHFDPTTLEGYEVLKQLPIGGSLSKLIASQGIIYGFNSLGAGTDSTHASLFSYNIASGEYKRLHDFGIDVQGPPMGFLQFVNGEIIGLVRTYETTDFMQHALVFKYTIDNGNYEVIVDQVTDTNIGARFIVDGNILYGGSTSGIFRVDLDAKTLEHEIDLTGEQSIGGSNLLEFNGKIYWASNSAILQYDLSSKQVVKLYDLDGAITGNGYATIFKFSNQVYGTFSGASTLFNFDPTKPGSFNVLHNFDNAVQDVLILRGTQTITLSDITKTIGDADFTPNATSNNPNTPITFTSDDEDIATIVNGKVHIVAGGTVHITALQGESDAWDATSTTVTLVINKKSQTLAGFASFERNVDANNITFPAKSSGGIDVNYTLDDPTVATLAGNVLDIHALGQTDIRARNDGDGQYLPLDLTITLTVSTRQPQTITAFSDIEKALGAADFTLGAVSSSGLPVSYQVGDASVAIVTGNSVHLLKAGTTTLTALQTGNADFAAADPVTVNLKVNQGLQTITFPQIADKTLGDAAFTLLATTNSGLNLSYTTTTPDRISINGTQVTVLKPGKGIIKANQNGNDDWTTAAPVENVFCIKAARPTLTLSIIDPSKPVLISNAAENNVWYVNDEIIPGETGTTLVANGQGVYKVGVKTDDCLSDLSNAVTLVITGFESDPLAHIDVYPNPADSYIDVKGLSDQSIQVMDLTGRVHAVKFDRHGDVYRGDIQQLSAGLYILQLSDNRVTRQVKFIKK